MIYNALNNKDYVFTLQENKQVKTILIFKQYRENIINLDYMKIASNLKNKEQIISFALTTILKTTRKDIKIFRVNLLSNSNKNLKLILNMVGFEKTAFLKDEIGVSIDIEEYSYYV